LKALISSYSFVCQHRFRLFNVLRHCANFELHLGFERTPEGLALNGEPKTAGAEMQPGASTGESILRIGR